MAFKLFIRKKERESIRGQIEKQAPQRAEARKENNIFAEKKAKYERRLAIEKEPIYKKKFSMQTEDIEQARYKRDSNILKRQQAYSRTNSGRIGSGIGNIFGAIRNPVAASYRRGTPSAYAQKQIRTAIGYIPPTKVRRGSGGYAKPGRPFGTVKYTDPSTGQSVGVYEYRKILSARLARERSEYFRNRNISPEQQLVLDRIAARNRAIRMNQETQTFPSTAGDVNLGGIMKEINDATNILD